MSVSSTIEKAHSIWVNHLKDNWFVYFLGTLAVIVTNMMQVIWTRGLGWIIDFFSGDPFPNWFVGKNGEATFTNIFLVLFASRIFLFVGRWGWRVTLARQTHYAAAKLRRNVFESSRFFPRRDLDKKFKKDFL